MAEFEWSDTNTLFPSVGAVAVYQTLNGCVVIRQKRTFDDEEDVVAISKYQLAHLIEALEGFLP